MLLNQFERLNFKVMEKFVIVQNIDFTISKFHCLSHIDEYEITGRWFIKGNATIAIDKCHIFPCILHITPGRMQPSLLTNAAFSQEASECALQKQLRL